MCVDVSTALMAASGVAKAASSVFGGIAARKEALAAAEDADREADFESEQAGAAIAAGSDAAALRSLKTGALIGDQAALMAASGVELGFGSPLEAVGSTAILGEVEASEIRGKAKTEAEERRTRALALRRRAEAYRASGRVSFAKSLLSAADTLLGGAGQVASKLEAKGSTLRVPGG